MSLNPIQQQTLLSLRAAAAADHLTPAQISQIVNSLTHQSLATALSHSGLTPAEQAQVMNQVTKGMQNQLTNELGAQGLQKNKGAHGAAGGGSWLEAIAEAMGNALGQMAQKLVDESNSLQSLAGNQNDAQQFQATMAKFQADSQMFSMLSNAFSTAIKSIGDGMTTMASKQ
ncbi:MAG TPA: hypothetical protein VI653_30020 [Steroidobacteraceae bacterium]